MAIGGAGIGTATAEPAGGGGGHARAVAEANALLAEAPVLTGATSRASAPVKILAKAPQRAAYNQLVQRASFWTVNESWQQTYAALTGTTPAGLSSQGSGRIHGWASRDDERFAVYSAETLPTGIAYAVLLVSVAPDGHDKAAIGVYAQAVPQPARPTRETVPSSVTRAHVAVRTRVGHIVRGSTVTGAAAATLISDFNALMVSPPGERSCPADFGRRELVTFHIGGDTIVATTGFCGFVDVTRNGHRLPPLSMSRQFGKDIASDLAPAPTRSGGRPKRPRSEHVPLSLRRAHLALRDEPFDHNRKSLTVTGKQAARLVRAFDSMKTVPRHYFTCDIAGGPQTIVTFRTAAHTWVVKQSACTNVVVTRDGKKLPTLIANGAWDKAIAHDLGH
jgi:hypothetical protein